MSQLQGMQGMQGMQGISAAGTLSPGADPAFCVGLMTSREALMQPHGDEAGAFVPLRPLWGASSTNMPSMDNSEHLLKRWSSDIRHENLLAELIEPLRMVVNAKDQRVQVFHLETNIASLQHEKNFTGTAHCLYTLQRPKRQDFELQLPAVNRWAELRPERAQEIITQIGIPMQYWSSILDLNPTNHPWTLQLLSLTLACASYLNQPSKHHLACPRPVDYSPGIQPIINARRFAAFPSGHATEAFVVARMLQMVTGQERTDKTGKPTAVETQLQRLAARISNNRVIAGVHFPIDATSGRMVAETLCEYIQHRCADTDALKVQTKYIPRHFHGQALQAAYVEKPFDRSERFTGSTHFSSDHDVVISNLNRTQVLSGKTHGGLLPTLWALARQEWQ
jgi:hypothetical protein